MADITVERGGFLQRFQSNFVLTMARYAFLAAAALSLLAVMGGLAAALYFYSLTIGQPTLLPIPNNTGVLPTALRMDHIDARMVAPHGIRFVVTRGLISQSMSADELGYFEAVTPNGLARYPDDFDILGGKDTAMFRRVPASMPQPRSGLAATAALAERINSARVSADTTGKMNFELTVVARDSQGALSAPADIVIELAYGPPPALPSPTSPVSGSQTADASTDLQRLAREIAQYVDPTQGSKYEQIMQRALQLPQSCGASERTEGFVAGFRLAFEHARSKLIPTSFEPFLAGVCAAWRQLKSEQDAVRAQAESARNAVVAENARAMAEFEIRKTAGWAGRNVALAVVGSAVGTFLTVALLLALLAIENHSKALRDAAEALTNLRKTAEVDLKV